MSSQLERKSPRPLELLKGKPGPYTQAALLPTRPVSPATSATFELLFSSNPLAMYVCNRQTLEVLDANPAAIRQYGYSRDQLLGMRVSDLRPGDEKHLMVDVGRINGPTAVSLGNWRQQRSNGEVFEVEVTAQGMWFSGQDAVLIIVQNLSRGREAHGLAEEKYRRIFDNAVDGLFESTPGGQFIAVNPSLARIAGYSSPADMIREVHDIAGQIYAHPTNREEVKRRLEEKGVLENYECQMRRKDSSLIWVSLNIHAIRDASGQILSYDGTVEDIGARKRSEVERLASSEIIHAVSFTDNLDDLLRLVHAALCKVLDARNCFVALHDSATGLFHFPFHADQFDATPVAQKLRRSCTAYVFRSGKAMLISQKQFDELVRQGEVELIGTPSASWLGVPLRTPAETIGVLVAQNYTTDSVYSERDLEFLESVAGQIALAIERKRTDERIRGSEARLRVLIGQLPAVLWTVDRNLRFTSALGTGLARLGLKPDEIVGMSLAEYFEKAEQTFAPIAAHRRAVNGEAVTFPVEWKDGSYACHVEPLRDASGSVQGAICMALDVTDRKKLEAQFRQAQKMEAVGRLAGGIAHDFNNLLMVIQGYADLLADRLPSAEPMRRNAEQIQAAAQRAASLTQQLLAFSRKQILAPKVLNVYSVVADMEKMLQRVIGEDIQLQTSTEPDLGLVKADRSQIEQVVMNLAVNARDAMPSGGSLIIETSNVEFDASISHPPLVLAPGKYVMLAVTDNGTGMDSATQAHIFEPFFTTKEKGKGTGLGLATVYGVVKQSGGYVWVYSEVGHGTTFKIYLPRIEEETVAPERDRAPDTRHLPRGTETVLLVEDEAGVRDLAREYLEMSGYQVIVAEDGRSALDLAARNTGAIDLLMTDMVMPGIGGRELAQRIRKLRPNINVLYMSGYADQAVQHQGILTTDAALLQKPFTLAALTMKLREILDEAPARQTSGS